jgi:uncharacterized membrane protein YciS (DUF1049 family)
MYKLPIYETLWSVYSFLWRHPKDLVAYATLPILVTTIASIFMATTGVGQSEYFNFLIGYLGEGSSEFLNYPILNNGCAGPIIAGTIAIILQAFVYITFSLAWSRHYLMGPASSPSRTIFRWRRRHTRYVGFGIATIVIFLIPFVISIVLLMAVSVVFTDEGYLITESGFAFSVLLAIAFIIASAFTARFWLVFPASTVDDEKISLRRSRRMTKGNMWRIWFVFWLAVGIPSTVIIGAYAELFFEGPLVSVLQNSVVLLFLVVLIQEIIEFAFLAASMACLAEIYRRFVHNAPAETGQEGSSPA